MVRLRRRRDVCEAFATLVFLLAPGYAVAQSGGGISPNDEPATAPDPLPPLSAMPDIGVDWPDMGDAASLPTDPDARPIVEQADRFYAVSVEGLDQIDGAALRSRFDTLSTLKAGEGKAANNAQIDRRAREDQDLLNAILRAAGYYDAEVESRVVAAPDGRVQVTMQVQPGPLYRFSDARIEGLEAGGDKATAMRPTFPAVTGEAVNADTVLDGQTQLERKLKNAGFPFAKVSEPDIIVDHETRTASIVLPVDTGGARSFGKFIITGSKPPFDARHVAQIARFKTGEPYDQLLVDDLRRALIATGVAGGVDVTPMPAAGESADIQVAMEPAKLRTLAGEAGYGTDEGVRVELSWTHRNLIKPEGAVTVRGVAGTREQSFGALFSQTNFKRRDHVLKGRFSASHLDRPAFEARTIEIGANLERQSNFIWQKRWVWSFGGELIATDERDQSRLVNPRSTFLIGAIPLSVGYDKSNDLLDPKRGFRLSARFSPEVSLRSGTSLYVRSQIDGSAYLPVASNITFAGRLRLGSIAGANRLEIAPSRRFYAGGGGSVRGFGFQGLGPRDANNDPVGGRSLTEFAVEARVRWREFGIVPFVDGGNVYSKPYPDFSGLRYAVGLGLRYHSNFGPIRLDIGTPVNRRKGDSPVTVFVSLGQAF